MTSDLICVSNSRTDPRTNILYKSIEIRYNLGPTLFDNYSYLNVFVRKIENEDWDMVAITSCSSRSRKELDSICNILESSNNHIGMLRFSHMTGKVIQHMLDKLAGKVECHTLALTGLLGNNSCWQSSVATFINESNSLHTLRLAHMPYLHSGIKNAILRSSVLLNLEFMISNNCISSYEWLSEVISRSSLQKLHIKGSNISLSSLQIIHTSLRQNNTLLHFSHADSSIFYKSSEWDPILKQYNSIVCCSDSIDNIVASNHTLQKVNLSFLNRSLQENLDINKAKITNKGKIKKKIFLCKDAIEQWIKKYICCEDKDEQTQRRKLILGIHYIAWLGHNNEGDRMMKNLSLSYLFSFFRQIHPTTFIDTTWAPRNKDRGKFIFS